MVSALLLSAIGLVLLGAAGSNAPALYLARLLDGAARGAITATTLAYAADLCGKAETSFSRVRGFGALAAAAGAGFLIAPPIGDHLAVSYLPKLTMAANFGAVLALVAAAAAANFLRDPRRFSAAELPAAPATSIKTLLTPRFAALAGVRVLSVVATAAVTSTLYHTLSGRPGMGVVATADTLALLGAAQLLTHGVLVAPLVRLYGACRRRRRVLPPRSDHPRPYSCLNLQIRVGKMSSTRLMTVRMATLTPVHPPLPPPPQPPASGTA